MFSMTIWGAHILCVGDKHYLCLYIYIYGLCPYAAKGSETKWINIFKLGKVSLSDMDRGADKAD